MGVIQHRTVQLDRTFEFKGNMNGINVQKFVGNIGDGEISSSKGKTTYYQVDGSVSITGNKLTVFIRYIVTEGGFNANDEKKKNKDQLVLNGSIEVDLDSLFGGLAPKTTTESNKTTTVFKSWKLISDIGYASYYGEYTGENHNYFNINIDKYPNYQIKKEWLPWQNLYVKIDDSGNELNKEGNLSVKGRINIYFELTTDTTTIEKIPQLDNNTYGTSIKGINPVITIPQKVRNVMGRGYDIKGEYAAESSVKQNVLDLDKLNTNNLLYVSKNPRTIIRSINGESKKEISSQYEKKLNITISAQGFGATFKNETNKTINEEESYSEGRRYCSFSNVQQRAMYKADITPSTPGFFSLLSQSFINALNTQTADQIIKNYGTHVILGMVQGARVTYSMSYLKSIEKLSKSKCFKNSTEIGYSQSKEGGLEKKEGAVEKKSSADLFCTIVEKLGDNLSTEDLKYLSEILKSSKTNSQPANNNGASGKSNAKDIAFQLLVGIEVNNSESSTFENESMKTECYAVGGNMALTNRIRNDLNEINTWLDSLNDSNANEWADFVAGTLYPIYEFVPAGCKITANELRTAWERELNGEDAEKECGRTYISVPFTCVGSKNKVVQLNEEEDDEIDTSGGKKTGWRLYMEPVNLDSGDVAIAVQLTVGEGGLNGGRSLLRLNDLVTIPKQTFPRIAIDSTKVRTIYYEKQGEEIGKKHGYFDITHLLRDCSFVDTTSNTFSISIDGSGGDTTNLKVNGVFKVPVIGYNN